MKKFLFLKLIVLTVMLTYNSFAQINGNSLIFASSQDNLRYLRYFSYTNNFGDAAVHYRVGEFNLNSRGVNQRIILHKDLEIQETVWGNPALGEDLKLRDCSKSYDFIVPANSTINFYRTFYTTTDCNYKGGGNNGVHFTDDPNYNSLSPSNKLWASGIGTILDRTEWTIQVVSSANDSCLFTIDSIGIKPNPESICANVYGTNPQNSSISVSLPSFLVGQNVYLRVSPRRWGPTPFGMSMTEEYTDINLSNTFNLTNGVLSMYSDVEHELLEIIKYNHLIDVYDAEIASGNCITVTYLMRMQLSKPHVDSIMSRYAQCFTPYALNKQMTENNTPIYTDNKTLVIQSVYPTPINGSEFNLALNAKSNLKNFKYVISSINGSEIVSGLIPSIPAGESSIKIQLPAGTNSGSYNLSISDASGMIFGSTMIMIAR